MLQSIPSCMCALNPLIYILWQKASTFTKLTIRKTLISHSITKPNVGLQNIFLQDEMRGVIDLDECGKHYLSH